MGKGIFFNLPGATSHINPTLGLVQALTQAGETIVYYADEGNRCAIEKTGAQFKSAALVLVWDHRARTVFATAAVIELGNRAVFVHGWIRRRIRQRLPNTRHGNAR